jgi:hypothetical protein
VLRETFAVLLLFTAHQAEKTPRAARVFERIDQSVKT